MCTRMFLKRFDVHSAGGSCEKVVSSLAVKVWEHSLHEMNSLIVVYYCWEESFKRRSQIGVQVPFRGMLSGHKTRHRQ